MDLSLRKNPNRHSDPRRVESSTDLSGESVPIHRDETSSRVADGESLFMDRQKRFLFSRFRGRRLPAGLSTPMTIGVVDDSSRIVRMTCITHSCVTRYTVFFTILILAMTTTTNSQTMKSDYLR